MRKSVTCGEETLDFEIPDGSLAWELWPSKASPVEDAERAIREAILNPIGSPRLGDLVEPGMKVVILADDFTRPTPRQGIIRVLLDELNQAGVPDGDITIMIALGTHRYMTPEEIRDCFGEDIVSRVEVINHEWLDPENLVDLGTTENGTPIIINKRAYQADLLVGVGSIVPHCFAGFSGGAKIVQPGISGPDTTAATHFLICQDDRQVLNFAGTTENRAMDEMRKVAKSAGLRFIVNVVFNADKEVVEVVAGDIVEAHKAGMRRSGEIFIREIEEKVDVVISEALPADADMWQATKPLSYARRTIEEGKSLIFVIAAPDGVAPNHPFMEEGGECSYREIKEMMLDGRVEDRVAGSILLVIKKATEDVHATVVSPGLTRGMKQRMALGHADTVQEAVDRALERYGPGARIGIIHHGGDVLPVPRDMR